MKDFYSLGLKIERNVLKLLDQQLLPDVEKWIDCLSLQDICDAIVGLKTRGAPLIGASAAAFLQIQKENGVTGEQLLKIAQTLRGTRPTAVNLMNLIDRVMIDGIHADDLLQEDVNLCKSMAANGLDLINNGDNILTHCNTGGLATVGIGTALGVIAKAHLEGKNIHVYVDETRPLLQGGRLTTWELEKLKIPYTLICDNMAASLMKAGKIQKIFVGADRVALNGDFANKIGTYSLAVAAKYHSVAFYPVAPQTTIDKECDDGEQIEIEMRMAHEVQGANGSFGNIRWAPKNCNVYNPAFDVTAVELITALVTDMGTFSQQELKAGIIKKYLLN